MKMMKAKWIVVAIVSLGVALSYGSDMVPKQDDSGTTDTISVATPESPSNANFTLQPSDRILLQIGQLQEKLRVHDAQRVQMQGAINQLVGRLEVAIKEEKKEES